MAIVVLLISTNRSVLGFATPRRVLFGKKVSTCSEKKGNRTRNEGIVSGDSPTTQSHEKTVVIAYHKPPNTITSHSDTNALVDGGKHGDRKNSNTTSATRTTVYDDILSMTGWKGLENFQDKNRTSTDHNFRSSFQDVTGIRSKVHAIGRLDCDTTGLLLLTNDGGLVHHVTNPTSIHHRNQNGANGKAPSFVITKTYEALIMGYHNNSSPSFETMRTQGVDIGAKYGGRTKPVEDLVVLKHPTAKSTLVSLTISEGKNRQVRRMFHSIGSGVMKLKRVRIGEKLGLKGLEEGQWRIMSDKEVHDTLKWSVRSIETKTPSLRNIPGHRRHRKRETKGGNTMSNNNLWRR